MAETKFYYQPVSISGGIFKALSGYTLTGPGTISSATLANATVTTATSSPAIRATSSMTGGGVEAIVNGSSGGIALNGLSASTASPAVVGTSTGYYGGSFANVTDLGSSGANANAIGVVGTSRQSNAGYMQQGDVTVPLTRANVYPGFYVTRVGPLGGFDFTGGLLEVEDVTAATGPLMRLIAASGAVKFTTAKSGETEITANSGTCLTLTNAQTGDCSLRIRRQGGTASDWFLYAPSGSTNLRLYSGADRFTFAADGRFTAAAFTVGATPGVSFSGAITNITIVNGIVTAAS
jgi:hypothetical protein